MVLAWEKGGEALKQLKQRWYENPNIAAVTVELIVLESFSELAPELACLFIQTIVHRSTTATRM